MRATRRGTPPKALSRTGFHARVGERPHTSAKS
jgi:hypothetical protein